MILNVCKSSIDGAVANKRYNFGFHEVWIPKGSMLLLAFKCMAVNKEAESYFLKKWCGFA